MSGVELRTARRQLRLRQRQLAQMLGVSQPYLSLMEQGRRSVPLKLAKKLGAFAELPPTLLPLKDAPFLEPQTFASSLGAVGYPPYSHFANEERRENPATLLLQALQQKHVEPRLTEALPWLVLHYPALNWEWLVSKAKQYNLQNRLGFVVCLARQAAEKRNDEATANVLRHWEHVLEDARLAKVDTLSRHLTNAEAKFFATHRTPAAEHWNLLTGMNEEALSSYA